VRQLSSLEPSVWSGVVFFLARHGFDLDETTESTGMLFSSRDFDDLRAHDLAREINARVPEAHAYVRYFDGDAVIGVRAREVL
jgi:hypothetical protein